MLSVGLVTAVSSLFLVLISYFGYRLRKRNKARRRWTLSQLRLFEHDETPKYCIAGFFHPYCNAGGGGERVLWTAIACLQQQRPRVICLVYTGDASEDRKSAIVDKVKNRFGIELDATRLLLVHLPSLYLVEDSTWPRFTLLGQSVGSIFLALEGLSLGMIPDIWIDTMGYAFAYPFVRALGKVPIASYTHYPTISTDMLKRVSNREAGHTNTDRVARSAILSSLKLAYYLIFSELYSMSLRKADVLMVNSSWTKNHVDYLLKPLTHRDDDDDVDDGEHAPITEESTFTTSVRAADEGLRSRSQRLAPANTAQRVTRTSRFKKAEIVFPPCETNQLSALPLELRENLILSVAQFRPEKEHSVQLEAFKLFLDKCPQYKNGKDDIKLVLAGSVRNEGDEQRVEDLRSLARKLDIQDHVEFAVNLAYIDLVDLFRRASIGLHTMVDEHFGITVVEFQAAGLVPLVHASAGPLLDIVVPYDGRPTGFHAASAQEFADRLEVIVDVLDEDTLMDLRLRARKNAQERFSREVFEQRWMAAWTGLERRLTQQG